jgi:hypothetical protein
VNSAVQRARKVIDTTAPTQEAVLRDLGDEAVGAIVARWTDVWQAGDVDAIVALLADDARYSMPLLPSGTGAETRSARSCSMARCGPAGGSCPPP